jgi:hypothetical protein
VATPVGIFDGIRMTEMGEERRRRERRRRERRRREMAIRQSGNQAAKQSEGWNVR